MKWKNGLIALIVGIVAFGSLTIADEALAHSLDGRWTLNYFWDGASADVTDASGGNLPGAKATSWWDIRMTSRIFGTFSDGQGNSGTVIYLGRRNLALVIYDSGCYPVYVGNLNASETYMDGDMWCRQSGPGHGTFNAEKQ